MIGNKRGQIKRENGDLHRMINPGTGNKHRKVMNV